MTTPLDLQEVEEALRPTFHDIRVLARPWPTGPGRLEITFLSAAFRGRYPRQRYHAIVHALPRGLQGALLGAVWRELAPGESWTDVEAQDVPDSRVVEISACVLGVLRERGFPRKLEAALPAARACDGDFTHTRATLAAVGLDPQATREACHVLMHAGAYCDCETLYNVFRESALARRHFTP